MLTDVFNDIYRRNLWKSEESRSGRGAEFAATENVRKMLPVLIDFLSITSILDASCGDFNWMQHMNLEIPYYGCDIVQELVDQNNARYGNPNRNFVQADITHDQLQNVNLILCRCTLYHLSFKDIFAVLSNFRKNTARYLLLTNMPKVTMNTDIKSGGYRRLNLDLEPFNLGPIMFYFWDAPGTNEVLALYRNK